MKILLLADEESKYLWDYFEKEKLDGIDLIISCGDLKAEYLSFLATFTTVPVLYVHGNHDVHYDRKAPDGCVCIDDAVFVYKGLRIAGLGVAFGVCACISFSALKPWLDEKFPGDSQEVVIPEEKEEEKTSFGFL